ncbi:MAG: sugar phosphate nucleotidyltransferase [Reyranellaceae bacterium]
MTIRILVLGAGATPDGQHEPIWLAERQGELLIERLVQACARLHGTMIFAARRSDIAKFHLDSVASLAATDAVVVPVEGPTQGAACTALLCLDHIEPTSELLILNGNEFIDADYEATVTDFRSRDLDAGLIVFPSLHPRYSYVRLDENRLVEEAAEKHPISRNAIAGFFWFRKGREFVEGAKAMIGKDAHHNGHFYMSLVLNELVLRQLRVGVAQIAADRYRPLKSRSQVAAYEEDASG